MTDKEAFETLFYIHFRNASTGETGHHTGTYALDIGEIWVKSLNADVANKAKGLTHWLEPAGADEPNGVERGPF